MTLSQHVYAIKNLLAHGTPSDDFSFSNRLIAHYLQVSRAFLIEKKIDKYNIISEQSYQDLCLELTPSNFHNCCDFIVEQDDCEIMKSTVELPKFLNSRWGNFIRVTDLAGSTIPEITVMQKKYLEYALNPANKTQTGWFMHNNHLYVINNSFLSKVLLNALFDNPAEIHDLNCNVTESNCNDFQDEEFPIDSDLVQPMYSLTLEYLTRAMQLPQDVENDAADQTIR